jgi:hypothetical protein
MSCGLAKPVLSCMFSSALFKPLSPELLSAKAMLLIVLVDPIAIDAAIREIARIVLAFNLIGC